MNLRRLMFGGLTFCSLAFRAECADGVGRFQLCSATLNVEGEPAQKVFRIDTVTGKVDVLVWLSGPVRTVDGTETRVAIIGWNVIPDSLADEFQKYQEMRKTQSGPVGADELKLLPDLKLRSAK